MGIDKNSIQEVLLKLASIAKETTAVKQELVVELTKTEPFGRFFLGRAVSCEWNPILREALGDTLFNNELQQAYIAYLLRTFESSPKELFLSVSSDLDKLSRYNLFRILNYANEQEPEITIEFALIAEKLAEAPDDIYGSTLCEYIVRVIEIDKTWQHTQELVADIIRFNHRINLGYREFQPKLDNHSFEEFMKNGFKKITNHRPVEAINLVLNSINDLIKLRIEKKDNYSSDIDEIHCQRVEEAASGYNNPEELAVICLTQTCIQVLDTHPEYASHIKSELDVTSWNITKRVSAYIYSCFTDLFFGEIKKWINDNLGRISNDRLEREEKFMLARASEKHKEDLFSKEELERLFLAVTSGPDVTSYHEHLRNHFPDEDHATLILNYKKKSRYQLLSLIKDSLSGPSADYFGNLEDELGCIKSFFDEDREQTEGAKAHVIQTRSPKKVEELSAYSDSDLIDYLNTWNQGGRNTDHFYVDVTTRALADTLKRTIVANPNRFIPSKFNWKRVENADYHSAAINAIQELYKNGHTANLDNWLALLDWILDKEYQLFSQTGSLLPAEEQKSEADPESHRAVLNLINMLIKSESNTPIELRPNLANLLDKLCSTKQSRLEGYVLESNDPTQVHGTAINSTRSLALETLSSFALWIHRSTGEKDASPSEDCSKELRVILDRRIEDGPDLSPPELSILAVQLGRLSYLNSNWIHQRIGKIFPEDDQIWSKVFASHILYSKCLGWLYELTEGSYARACNHLNLFRYKERNSEQVVAQLGSHIFLFYLWGKFELPNDTTDESNLLSLFYLNATDEEKRKAFSKITHMLDTDSELESDVVDRSVAFIEYRISNKDLKELDGFEHLLGSNNFNKVWLLEKYAELLDYKPTDGNFRSYELDHFFGAIENEPLAAARCFEKLTKRASTQDRFYLHSQDGKKFLKLLLEHDDAEVVKSGEQAQANLLNAEMFEYLEV